MRKTACPLYAQFGCMQNPSKAGHKVNDNLHCGTLIESVGSIRPNSTRRACLCPVCITPPQEKEGVLYMLSPNHLFLKRPPGAVGLLKSPNATGGRLDVNERDYVADLLRGTEMRPRSQWPERLSPERFREVFKPRDPQGYMHVYRELDDLLTSWRPKLTQVGKPPVRTSRLSVCLSGTQKKKIKLATRYLDSLGGSSVFLTLTFKESQTCHSRAKRDLDTFLKRYKRHTGSPHFLWVAELQKRGTIHFHLVLKSRVDMGWFQRSWREITGQDVGQQDVRPIKGAHAVSRYLSKYIAKGDDKGIFGRRYSMNRETVEAIKPIPLETSAITYQEWHDKMSAIGCQIGQNVIYLTQ